ncbi:F-box/LRR-repeat protein 17-like [Argonauta hians]
MEDDSGKLDPRTLKRCQVLPIPDREQLNKVVRRDRENADDVVQDRKRKKMISIGVEAEDVSVSGGGGSGTVPDRSSKYGVFGTNEEISSEITFADSNVSFEEEDQSASAVGTIPDRSSKSGVYGTSLGNSSEISYADSNDAVKDLDTDQRQGLEQGSGLDERDQELDGRLSPFTTTFSQPQDVMGSAQSCKNGGMKLDLVLPTPKYPQSSSSLYLTQLTNSKSSPCRTATTLSQHQGLLRSEHHPLLQSTTSNPPWCISETGHRSMHDNSSEACLEHTSGALPSCEEDVSLHILNLPNSILLEIFKYLTIPERIHSVELVCKKWSELAKDPSLWRHINCQDFGHRTLSDEILDKITSYSNHVVHLDISNTIGFSPEGISKVFKKCQSLTYLSLKGCCSLPDSAIQLIADYHHELERLYLDDCFSVTNPTIIKIFHSCPRLTHLSFGLLLDAETIDTMITCCPRLRLINLSYCEAVDSMSVMLDRCKHLEHVNLSNCPLTDSHLTPLTKLPALKHVYLNSVRITSKTPIEVAKHCTQLHTLSLCFNDCVDDSCIASVVHSARNLRVLKCIRCRITDKALISIGQCCSQLEQLDISFCSDVTAAGVGYVSAHCTKLHFLGLFSCDRVDSAFLFQLQEQRPHTRIYCFELEYRSLIERVNEEDGGRGSEEDEEESEDGEEVVGVEEEGDV